jgi:hypothetical protein
MIDNIIIFILFVCFLVVLILTFNLFDNSIYYIFPSVATIIIGLTILMFIYNMIRYRCIHYIVWRLVYRKKDKHEDDVEFVVKLVKYYRDLKNHDKNIKARSKVSQPK